MVKRMGVALLRPFIRLVTNVSGFEKRGHFDPDVNLEILLFTEIIGNQLSFAACLMFTAARIHFLCMFIVYRGYSATCRNE